MTVFVQATDGRFYRRPRVIGDDWWICFDDGDDPEIVVRQFKNSTPWSCQVRAGKVMREAGIGYKELRHCQQGKRIFPPDWDKFLDGQSFNFQLMAPIPIPGMFDAVVDEPGAVWEHCIYGFFTDVSAEECARAVLGMDIRPLIARALLKQAVYKKDIEKVRPEICKKLYAQAPWLRELRRETWAEQLKDQPKTVRIEWRL